MPAKEATLDRLSAVHPRPHGSDARSSGSRPPRLSIADITKSFPGDIAPTLRDVSFQVDAGEFVALVGPSGCGKSTLLNVVAGLLEPDGGSIAIDGAVGERLGRVAYMHQRDLLMPWRTVSENARLGLEVRGVDREASFEAVQTAAARFGLSDVLDRRPWQLSGGMRQRVALLRATLPQTGVLLLDEPFGALDAITRSSLQQWLAGVMRHGDQAVVLVTHDVEEALLLADRIHVMSGNPGRIVDTVSVDLPRPRSSPDTTSPGFIALKARLLSALDAGTATP